MIYSINFTMRGSIALEAENEEVARESAKDTLTSLGGDIFTTLLDIHELSPGLVDLHERYDDQGQEVMP